MTLMGLPAPLLVPPVLPWLAGPEPPQVAPAAPGLQLWPAPGEGVGEGAGDGIGDGVGEAVGAQLWRVGSQAGLVGLLPGRPVIWLMPGAGSRLQLSVSVLNTQARVRLVCLLGTTSAKRKLNVWRWLINVSLKTKQLNYFYTVSLSPACVFSLVEVAC